MKPRVSTPTLGAIIVIAVMVLAGGVIFVRYQASPAREVEEDERYSASLGVYNYYRPEGNGFRRDRVELEQRFKDVIGEATERARQQASPDRGQMGRIHELDRILKRILKEDYGIEWRTTAEMNPEVCID